jgi:hypothetical protein
LLDKIAPGGFISLYHREDEDENMGTDNRAWSAQRSWGAYRVIFPVLAGVIMLASSLLPWLVDPLGERFSAWALPIDLGWQLRSGLFNYGLLNVACALYVFLVAFRAWKALRAERGMSRELVPTSGFVAREELTLAGLLCLVPVGLFFLQYLLIDMSSATELVRHQIQASLIKLHLSYGSAPTFIPIVNPVSLDPLNLSDRATVVINNLGSGLFLPGLSVLLLFVSRIFWPKQQRLIVRSRQRLWWVFAGALVLGIILGRGPIALVANFQAGHELSIGDDAKALQWLDTARMLNPELDQMASYHIERGQAWYYLQPGEENEEAKLYLSSTYQQQKDYLSSYEELSVIWNEYGKDVWVQDQLSTTLISLAEQNKPGTGALNTRLAKDNPALPWLQQLIQVDAQNAYGHYLLGRIYYDEHSYSSSFSQMESTIDLVRNNDLQSAAYTYLGLNSEMLGTPIQARDYLFTAVELDAGYRNNTARQELSGIR